MTVYVPNSDLILIVRLKAHGGCSFFPRFIVREQFCLHLITGNILWHLMLFLVVLRYTSKIAIDKYCIRLNSAIFNVLHLTQIRYSV